MGKAKLKDQHEVFLVDLPGVYSLHPRAEDEQVTHDVLKGERLDFPKPDAVILILDSTNLGTPPDSRGAHPRPGSCRR